MIVYQKTMRKYFWIKTVSTEVRRLEKFRIKVIFVILADYRLINIA